MTDISHTVDLSTLILSDKPHPEPDWENPRVTISIGLNARMQIIEIINDATANPYIVEMFDEGGIEDELEFDDEVGIYRAELSTLDTSYEMEYGREYDWDPVVKLTHKYNFITCGWDETDD